MRSGLVGAVLLLAGCSGAVKTGGDGGAGNDSGTQPGSDGGTTPTDGGGLASAYCGDQGIKNDPDVVFVEKFDEGSVTAAAARWDFVENPANLSLSTNVPPGSPLTHSMQWNYTSTGSLSVDFIKCLGNTDCTTATLSTGYDQLYFRYYVYFAPGSDPIWHFFRMGGGVPFGGAGVKPTGADTFVTSLEPNFTNWAWDFYTYWVDMRPASDGSFYGNNFLGENFNTFKSLAPPVATGQWICVEFMIKLNTITNGTPNYDGEQAFWLNGSPTSSNWSNGTSSQVVSQIGPGTPLGSWITSHWSPDNAQQPFDGATGTPGNGFRWRTVPGLQISYIRPLVYDELAESNTADNVNVAHLVVAKRYVGPLRTCP